MESGDIVLLFPWLMTYTTRENSTQRDAAQASEEVKLERASSLACRHARGVRVPARTLLAEPSSAGKEETWTTMVVKFLA